MFPDTLRKLRTGSSKAPFGNPAATATRTGAVKDFGKFAAAITPAPGVNPWLPGSRPAPIPVPAPYPGAPPITHPPTEGINPPPTEGINPPPNQINPNDQPTLLFDPTILGNAKSEKGGGGYGIGQGFLKPSKDKLWMPLPIAAPSVLNPPPVLGVPPIPGGTPPNTAITGQAKSLSTQSVGKPITASKPTAPPVGNQKPVSQPAATGKAMPAFKSPSQVRNFLRLRGR